MESKEPSKFILALRRYREHKRQLVEEMEDRLADEEEALQNKKNYLYHDIEVV